jgi:hypothetical protein
MSYQLREMVTWQGFTGWEGIECGSCGATHNVMIGGGAMFCENCGHCIVKSWNHHRMCFEKPDFGYEARCLGFATFHWGRYRYLLTPTREEAAHLKKVAAHMAKKPKNTIGRRSNEEVGYLVDGEKFVYGATIYEKTSTINDDGYIVCKGVRNWYGNPNCNDQAFPPDFDVACKHVALKPKDKPIIVEWGSGLVA